VSHQGCDNPGEAATRPRRGFIYYNERENKKKSAEVTIIICLAGSLFLNDIQPVLGVRGGHDSKGREYAEWQWVTLPLLHYPAFPWVDPRPVAVRATSRDGCSHPPTISGQSAPNRQHLLKANRRMLALFHTFCYLLCSPRPATNPR
jgi:hypothetical protein